MNANWKPAERIKCVSIWAKPERHCAANGFTIARFTAAPLELTQHDYARALDVVDGRVVVLGAQTVAGFDDEGALAFSVHYDAPRDPTWLRSLAWAEAVRAGMASAYAGAYGAATRASRAAVTKRRRNRVISYSC